MVIHPPYYEFDTVAFSRLFSTYQRIADVYFPLKANDSEMIVRLVAKLGGNFEVDSIEHVKYLITKIKVNPHRLLFSFPLREDRDIDEALRLGVRDYVVDSNDEFQRIHSRNSEARLMIRLNANSLLNDTFPPHQNKWGSSMTPAKELIQLADKEGCLMGVSFYVSAEVRTQNPHEVILRQLCEKLADTPPKCVDIGGGIPSEALPSLKVVLNQVKQKLGVTSIIVEPGRHLLDPCIDMCVSVIGIRRVEGKRLVFINAGIYSGLGDAKIKGKHFPIDDPTPGARREDALVCGNSSDVDDFIGQYDLRKDLAIGDSLYIRDCGAYSSVMSTRFCGREPLEMIPRSRK